jgi:hypothetical protein
VKPFAASDWQEVTLDIDETVKPDLVDRLPELALVETASFDAVYSSHNLEHLYPHEVPIALSAFKRVLTSQGFAIVTCPDLQSLAGQLAKGDIETPLYTSPAGPVSPVDMLYGFRPAMARGNLFMAHHTGFTLSSLVAAFGKAGFAGSAGFRRANRRDLWVIAAKNLGSSDELRELAKTYLVPA